MSDTKLTYGQWSFVTGFVGVTAILAFLLGAVMGLWTVWWLYPGWDWFMVPLGLPHISIWHFWALWLLLKFKRLELGSKEPKEAKPRSTSEYVIASLMVLLQPVIVWVILRWLVEAK